MESSNQLFEPEEVTPREEDRRWTEASEQSLLLNKISRNFGLTGGISLLFGGVATTLFYKAELGLNSFIFTVVMVILLEIVAKKLKITITRGVRGCFIGAILFGLSNVLTSSGSLQFINSIAILLLLEVSLIQLFARCKNMAIGEYLYKIWNLPIKTFSSINMFFVDSNRFIKDKKLMKNDKHRNILIGCVIAIPFMVLIISLLSSADLLFGKIIKSMFEWILYRDFYVVILMIILGALLCYSLLCGAIKEGGVSTKRIAKADSVIGITASSMLLLLYVLFCGIQVVYLFAGGLSRIPVEFTYAEYARRGFFELLAVTCLNIVLILFSINFFEEHRWLKRILTAITACTYIMIASATYRMLLYIGAYHLTFLRLIVLLFLLIDALVLAGIIISLYHKTFPLFAYSVVVVTLCYLAFSFSKPDYYIADYLIKHTEKIDRDDIYFLTSEISYDAAPIVVPVLERLYDDMEKLSKVNNINGERQGYIHSLINRYFEQVEDEADFRDIRDYNYSYDKALKRMNESSIIDDLR